ncbi:hypothetical protein [Cecembia sp.]|uniref:hypothetical protein n=1 Tax=Cecembia sp. TaxID=1898110 RepID=UPI0025C71B8A|nr:hypothetical protein [Cecembia sp.]
MRKIFNVLFLLFSFSQLSCQNEKIDENQLLKDEVIAIHDEVMPYMGELKSLKKEIDNKLDSLVQHDSLVHAEEIKKLSLLSEQLDHAFDGMFVWMRQFKAPDADAEKEEAKSYLLDQKEMVQKVNEDIKEALKLAKVELAEN